MEFMYMSQMKTGSNTHKKMRLEWAKKDYGVWTIEGKWYSVMNEESALAKMIMLVKHIKMTPWKKKKEISQFTHYMGLHAI